MSSSRPQTRLPPGPSSGDPALRLFCSSPTGSERFWEFFTANIRNPHTRRAYFHAVREFANWAGSKSLSFEQIRPIHIAAYVEGLGAERSRPTVKQHLAALRMLFDWLVTGGVAALNPAASVRGPKHSVKRGKTPVLMPEEMGQLLASLNGGDLKSLRDRALIALMAYTFARVGAAVKLRAEDYYIERRRGWIRLQEKGGKVTEMPCHHNLEKYLDEWLAASKLDAGAPLFPTFRNGQLTRQALGQSNVHDLVRRRGREAGIRTALNCHSFRATGITAYLKNGGRLEVAQRMAGHGSACTTGLYDRRNDDVALDEVERITF